MMVQPETVGAELDDLALSGPVRNGNAERRQRAVRQHVGCDFFRRSAREFAPAGAESASDRRAIAQKKRVTIPTNVARFGCMARNIPSSFTTDRPQGVKRQCGILAQLAG